MYDRSFTPIHVSPCSRLSLLQSAKMLVKLAVAIDRFRFKAQAFLSRPDIEVHHDHMAQTREAELKEKSKNSGCVNVRSTREPAFDRRYRWNVLITDALATRRRMRKSIVTAKAILCEMKNAGVDTVSPGWQAALASFHQSEWRQGQVFAVLTELGLDADLLQTAMQFLLKEDKLLNLQAVVQDMVTLSDRFSKRIEKRMLNASNDDEQDRALSDDEGINISIPCEKLPPPLDIGCALVAVAIIIVAGILALADAVEELLNATDDDNARNTVNRNTCEALNAMSTEAKIALINPMLSGPTGDEDERAILRLLHCSSCTQVDEVVNAIGLTHLLDEFHGDEWDWLMVRLRECGKVSFADWDDDATRLFINLADCSTLNSLRLADIRRLILNLFEGATGDDDELAIIKLVGCLSCSQRQALMDMEGTSFSDFDDNVDGEEWDTLRALLQCAGTSGTSGGGGVSDRPPRRTQ